VDGDLGTVHQTLSLLSPPENVYTKISPLVYPFSNQYLFLATKNSTPPFSYKEKGLC